MSDDDRFGSSVANIGDLDGDGVDDLAVGANQDDGGGLLRGAIHIMFMNTDGSIDSTVEINDSTANGPVLSDDDRFGISVANIGDLDGNGVDDLAVGSPRDDAGGGDRGAVHIMFLATTGFCGAGTTFNPINDTCEADNTALDTCTADLNTAQADLGTCNTDFATCQDDLAMCLAPPITGSIVIIKDTIPDSKDSFFFDSTTLPDQNKGKKGILQLQDDGTPDKGVPKSFTFPGLAAGIYDIEELSDSDFTTVVVCQDQDTTPFQPDNLVISFDGQIITCTFTNTAV